MHKKATKIVLLTGLWILLATACHTGQGGASPEDAVQLMLAESGKEHSQIARTYPMETGSLVLYRDPTPVRTVYPALSYSFGLSYLEQEKGKWWVRSGRSGIFTPEQGAGLIFLVMRLPVGEAEGNSLRLPFNDIGDSSNLPENPSSPMIVYGMVLDENIQEIQVTDSRLDTHNDAVKDAMFVVVLSGESLPCQLQLLDEAGAVLDESSLAGLPEWQVSTQLGEQIEYACHLIDQ